MSRVRFGSVCSFAGRVKIVISIKECLLCHEKVLIFVWYVCSCCNYCGVLLRTVGGRTFCLPSSRCSSCFLRTWMHGFVPVSFLSEPSDAKTAAKASPWNGISCSARSCTGKPRLRWRTEKKQSQMRMNGRTSSARNAVRIRVSFGWMSKAWS